MSFLTKIKKQVNSASLNHDNERLHQVVEKASEAFWAKVAEMYPEAKSGDLDAMSVHLFETAMQEVVKKWVKNNCD